MQEVEWEFFFEITIPASFVSKRKKSLLGNGSRNGHTGEIKRKTRLGAKFSMLLCNSMKKCRGDH